ncbi:MULTISPECIES: response regulator [Myxococcus]|uniref:Two-component system response regulator n=1 Tax=Myxococcus xanthus TaxID=34 RepID=A0AAE6G6E2_MYXXA|nr:MULTISPECIES: response regulator [Myxococcus]NOK06796.1 response regulator [Myxococcus xanthus]QDE71763.1 two-component system response regulator [Myxococcus xanthus]QDE79044.1 two-component system response regulator [Myxococcus xanthus]QDE86421.1 two-component system response regulator [Myxococcus xanthus]QDF08391.1 two-component system response regulator [Myxococcus xanthus]
MTAQGAPRRKKVLLVDDSDTVLLLQRMLLAELGHDAIVARDGLEALARAEQERPDLVFLDVLMPHLDGLETCRMLRGREPTRRTPIILCSARAEARSVRACFNSGCNDFVAKPFDGAALVALLRRYLD